MVSHGSKIMFLIVDLFRVIFFDKFSCCQTLSTDSACVFCFRRCELVLCCYWENVLLVCVAQQLQWAPFNTNKLQCFP